MNSSSLRWFAFALAVVLAWSFATFGWAVGWYMQGQIVFLLITIAAAALALRSSPRKWISVPIVLAGLAFANFGLLELGAMVTIWRIGGGFAP